MGHSVSVRRRHVIAGLGGAMAAPFVSRGAKAAGQIVIRNTGGTYDAVMRRSVYDPFTKATGIEVVSAGAPMSKMIATFKAGGAEYDVIDAGDGGMLTLERIGALSPINYDAWKFGKPDEISKDLRLTYRVACFVYSTVICYSTTEFKAGHPSGWAQFWDSAMFPGRRTLQDMASGSAPIEFALIADGVALDNLYPLDLDRAFRSLSRIRASVPKFWDSGALSNQLMVDKEVVLGGLWNGELQTLIDKGAPLAIDWHQNKMQVEAYGVSRTARNPAGAQLFVDFASQASAQLGYAKELHYGPANLKSFDLLPKDLVDALPGGPRYRDMGFFQNILWWEDNRDRVNRAWSSWVLG